MSAILEARRTWLAEGRRLWSQMSAERRRQRFATFENALAVGLPLDQALDEAGWFNPAAAQRYYQRAGRSMPRELRRADA